MEDKDFKTLKRGDVVQHIASPEQYVVMGNYGSHVIAVKTIHMMNPSEWDLILISDYSKPVGLPF